LKPDYAEAHSNLGNTLQELGRLEEAEASCRQAIALKSDFALAHSNLGKILYATGDKNSALSSVKRAHLIDQKSREFSLVLSVLQARKARENTESSVESIFTSDCILMPPSKILLLNMSVEEELTAYLYSTELLELDKEKDPSFGNTKGSKYDLFEDNHPTIQNLALELNSILMKSLNSDIFIYDSFFSIFNVGGGTVRHNHVDKRDNDSTFSLAKQKYALVYYLSVGDQECAEPGILKFYEPSEEIIPSKGLITIFPADRCHSSFYGGNKDRVIVGVNFYIL
jgi:tetratricopeptide (TPR) repeat protein